MVLRIEKIKLHRQSPWFTGVEKELLLSLSFSNFLLDIQFEFIFTYNKYNSMIQLYKMTSKSSSRHFKQYALLEIRYIGTIIFKVKRHFTRCIGCSNILQKISLLVQGFFSKSDFIRRSDTSLRSDFIKEKQLLSYL